MLFSLETAQVIDERSAPSNIPLLSDRCRLFRHELCCHDGH